MTFTEEYSPEIAGASYEEPDYPKAFGLTMTPKVIGIALAVAGLLGGAYLLLNQVLPTKEANDLLRADVEAKQGELTQLQAKLKSIDEVKAELDAAEARKQRVMALFAQEQSLDTLLLDISKLVPAPRPKPTGEAAKDLPPVLSLKGFTPTGGISLVNDGSLGEMVNGKLKRQTYKVALEGGYADTQKFISELERFQPLVQITGMSTDSEAPTPKITVGSTATVQLRPDQNPNLKTSFDLNVLMSRSPEEIAAEQAAAAAAPPAAGTEQPPAAAQ